MKTNFAFHKPVPRQVHTSSSPRRKNLPAAFFIGLYLLCPLASMAHDAHPPGTVVGLGSQVIPQVEPGAGEPKLWIRQRFDLLSHGIVEPLGMAAGAEGDVFVLGRSNVDPHEYWVLRVLPDGRIDPSFSQGRVRIPLAGGEWPPRLRSSGSGGFLVVPQTEGVLRRYLPNGSVDPSYADGLGVRIGPGSEFFWQEDGTVLIDSHENRVLVSETGQILFDTETVLRSFIEFAHRYPNGRVLLWRDGEIVWLLADGQPDPNPSPAFDGAIQEVRRDESGYVYLLFFDHEVPTVDGAPVSNLIRLNPDGSFDAEFQHGLTLAVGLHLQLDGSVVVYGFKGEEYGDWQVGSVELIPLVKPIFVPWPTSWRDTSAPLDGGGWVAAYYSSRGRGPCLFQAYLYTAGGPVHLQRTSRECWLWRGRIGVSTHGQDAWILSPDSLSRYSFVSSNDSFPAGRALVGFSESGRLQRSGPISFSVERAGDLSVPMVVTWSIAQVGLGGRPEGKARLRSISFEPFATTSPIELSEGDLSGMGSVREFELRLEEAEGADISTARVMRLLVFDPPGPATAQASLSLVPIPTRAAEALALLHVSGAGEYWLERSDNLEDWRRYFAEPVRLPFTSTSLLGPEGAGFYRLKRR